MLREQILQQDEVGQEILRLEAECSELLDTIWLATSTTQIRHLWSSVSKLIQEEETTLQAEAMKTEPMDDSKAISAKD